jgi:hypothetical protein
MANEPLNNTLQKAKEFMNVGDVISLEKHPTVPDELVGKYFKVEGFENGKVQLSKPYADKKCTKLYRSKYAR